jgi:hypothetical protein
MQNLKGDASLYNPAVLNVYYVHFDVVSLGSKDKELLESFTGMHIRNEQGESDRMIFISEGARADTVAHEFAHAFSAGHVNFWDFDGEEWCTKFLPHPETTDPGEEMEDMTCEFSRHNYMWAASELDRDRLGIPQGERMMYNQKSIIADFSVGPKQLDCPDYSNDIGVAADPDDDCKRLVGF